MDPTSMTVISGHGRSYQTLVVMCHHEKLRLHQELPLDILSRVIPRPHKSTNTPKIHHRIRV